VLETILRVFDRVEEVAADAARKEKANAKRLAQESADKKKQKGKRLAQESADAKSRRERDTRAAALLATAAAGEATWLGVRGACRGGEMRVQGSCPAATASAVSPPSPRQPRRPAGRRGRVDGGAGWEEEEVLDSGGLIRGPAAGGLQQGHFSLCRGGDAAGWRAGRAGLRAGREGRLDLRYTCGRPEATCGRPAAPCFRFAAGEWGDGGFSRRERGEGHGGWGSGRMRGRRGRRVCAYAATV
jgi:hypothetical protein